MASYTENIAKLQEPDLWAALVDNLDVRDVYEIVWRESYGLYLWVNMP